MKNFKILVIQEFLQQIKTLKFVLLLVVSLALSIVIGYLNINNYIDRHENYVEEVRKSEEAKKEYRVYSEFNMPVFNPPNPLSIFSKGYDEKADHKYDISPVKLPVPQSISVANNPLMVIFNSLDIIQLIAVIFSVWVLLMTAGAIVGEKEDATLKMIFANNVGRLKYFTTKYLGALIPLILAILISFITVILMILFNPGISVNTTFFVKILLLIFSSILFLSFYILLGLTISSISKTSSGAIVTSLFIWVILVFIYPNTVNYFVTSYTKTTSEDEFVSKNEILIKDALTRRLDWLKENRAGGGSCWTVMSFGNGEEGLEFMAINKFAICNKKAMEHFLKTNNKFLPEIISLHEQLLKNHIDFEGEKLKQLKVFKGATFFLPNSVFTSSCEAFCATGIKSEFIDFWDNVRIYRQSIMEYLEDKNAYGYKFFTTVPEELIGEFENLEKSKYSYDETKIRLEMEDAPRFSYSKKASIPLEAIGLIILNLIVFGTGIYFFNKKSLIA